MPGHLISDLVPGAGNLNNSDFKSSNARRFPGGWILKFRIHRYITNSRLGLNGINNFILVYVVIFCRNLSSLFALSKLMTRLYRVETTVKQNGLQALGLAIHFLDLIVWALAGPSTQYLMTAP